MTDVITGHEATKETCNYGHNLKPPVRVGELCCQLVIIPAKSGLRPYGLAPQREFRKGSSKVRHAIAAGGGTHESPLLMGLVESRAIVLRGKSLGGSRSNSTTTDVQTMEEKSTTSRRAAIARSWPDRAMTFKWDSMVWSLSWQTGKTTTWWFGFERELARLSMLSVCSLA